MKTNWSSCTPAKVMPRPESMDSPTRTRRPLISAFGDAPETKPVIRKFVTKVRNAALACGAACMSDVVAVTPGAISVVVDARVGAVGFGAGVAGVADGVAASTLFISAVFASCAVALVCAAPINLAGTCAMEFGPTDDVALEVGVAVAAGAVDAMGAG